MVSSSADVDLGPLPLRLGQQLNLDVNAQTHTSVHIADFNLKHPLPFLPDFSDLPLTGTLSADLVPHGATQLAAHVELPGVFTDQDGNGLTTNVTLKTNNTEGLVLDSFNVSIPNADLGFAEVQEVKLAYSRAAGDVRRQCRGHPALREHRQGHDRLPARQLQRVQLRLCLRSG